jgi:hypothetical protein
VADPAIHVQPQPRKIIESSLRGKSTMKLTDTQHFLLVTIGAASLAASFAFGNTESQPSASQKPVAAPTAERVVYFPTQYTLNAPIQVGEHIQAF